MQDDTMDATTFKQRATSTWRSHWTFFTSDQFIEVPEIDHQLKSLHLPKEVIDKIYRKNAERWIKKQI